MTGALHAVVTDQDVSPGVLGFVVVAAIGVATYFLIRSMRRQLKKIDIPEGGTPTRRTDAESDPPEATSDDLGG
ncbi:MAG TPA: hypothetical protein VGO19_03590 [Actinomycetes bacterium]|jgi:hypothetical protein